MWDFSTKALQSVQWFISQPCEVGASIFSFSFSSSQAHQLRQELYHFKRERLIGPIAEERFQKFLLKHTHADLDDQARYGKVTSMIFADDSHRTRNLHRTNLEKGFSDRDRFLCARNICFVFSLRKSEFSGRRRAFLGRSRAENGTFALTKVVSLRAPLSTSRTRGERSPAMSALTVH